METFHVVSECNTAVYFSWCLIQALALAQSVQLFWPLVTFSVASGYSLTDSDLQLFIETEQDQTRLTFKQYHSPPLWGFLKEWQTLHTDTHKRQLVTETDLSVIGWSRDVLFASQLRIVDVQSRDFRDGVGQFVRFRLLLISFPESASRSAVPANQ